MNFQLFIPTRLVFGSGKLNELSNQPMPGKKALLLISNGKSTKTNGCDFIVALGGGYGTDRNFS